MEEMRPSTTAMGEFKVTLCFSEKPAGDEAVGEQAVFLSAATHRA